MIGEAEALLRRARGVGPIGRYQLEAGTLQLAHLFRRSTATPNWEAVLQLYDALFDLTASPIVAVNRALIVAELRGPRAGLESLERIADERLTGYQPYWAARAELLSKTDQLTEARHAYEVAIGLELATLRFVASCKTASAPCERCTKGVASHVIGSNSARRTPSMR